MTSRDQWAALDRDPVAVAWADRAHAGRADQGLPEFIEDDETIDFIAAVLHGPGSDPQPPTGPTRSTSRNGHASSRPAGHGRATADR